MRRLLTGFVVAAMATVVPTLALAGNQEIAEQIARRLRSNGQMSDYKIGVKYQNGTAWLRGRVSSEEQMKTALRLTFQTKSVNRVINDLKVVSSEETSGPQTGVEETGQRASRATLFEQNPLRNREPESLVKRLESTARDDSREDAPSYADRVPSSYGPAAIRRVANEEPEELVPAQRVQPMARTRVAMMQPTMRGPVDPNSSPRPMYRAASSPAGVAPARYDQPCLPNYAWPSYAAYPNYAAVTYPKQYSPTAWPYIGPFYPYPQVPLGWRKVTLEWDSGWWFLDFKDQPASCWHR